MFDSVRIEKFNHECGHCPEGDNSVDWCYVNNDYVCFACGMLQEPDRERSFFIPRGKFAKNYCSVHADEAKHLNGLTTCEKLH